MTSSRQVHFDIPTATTETDTAQSSSKASTRPRRRRKHKRGMMYGYYVSPLALLANLRKNNAVVSEDLFDVSMDFRIAFCDLTNRRDTTSTFLSVAQKSGFCVVLSKGASMENEIEVLKKLLDTEEEPKWYPIEPNP